MGAQGQKQRQQIRLIAPKPFPVILKQVLSIPKLVLAIPKRLPASPKLVPTVPKSVLGPPKLVPTVPKLVPGVPKPLPIGWKELRNDGNELRNTLNPKPYPLGLLVHEPLHGEPVAFEAKAADAAGAVPAQQAFLAKFLAGGQVAQVHLNHGRGNGGHSIGQGNAGVGVGPGIEHDAMVGEAYFVQLIEQGALVVRLEVRELQIGKSRFQLGEKIIKRASTVDARLATAQQVQIGAIYYEKVQLNYELEIRSYELGGFQAGAQ